MTTVRSQILKTLAVFTALTAVSQIAMASPNQVFINQVAGNTAGTDVDESQDNNDIVFGNVAGGTGNNAYVVQNATTNTLSNVQQYGNNNGMFIQYSAGSKNSSSQIYQGNSPEQSAINHYPVATANGNDAQTLLTGDNQQAFVVQKGDYNTASSTQTGGNGNVTIIQEIHSGTPNPDIIDPQGNHYKGGNDAVVNTSGLVNVNVNQYDGNVAKVNSTNTGGAANNVAVQQSTTFTPNRVYNNVANVNQNGIALTANVHQNGAGELANVTQTGGSSDEGQGNTANVNQHSGGEIAVVTQANISNNSTIDQTGNSVALVNQTKSTGGTDNVTQTGLTNLATTLDVGLAATTTTTQTGNTNLAAAINNGYNNKITVNQNGNGNAAQVNTGRVGAAGDESLDNTNPTNYVYSAYAAVSQLFARSTAPTQGYDGVNGTGDGAANSNVTVNQTGTNSIANATNVKGEGNAITVNQTDDSEAYATTDGGQNNKITVNQQMVINGPADGHQHNLTDYNALGGNAPAGFGPKAGVIEHEGANNTVTLNQLGNTQAFIGVNGAGNTVTETQTNGDFPWSFNGQGKTGVNPDATAIGVVGDNNTVSMQQNGGYAQTGIASVTGSNNSISTDQHGYSNAVNAGQNGSNDTIVLAQHGAASATTSSFTNTATVSSVGNNDVVKFTQAGDRNILNVDQVGDHNTIDSVTDRVSASQVTGNDNEVGFAQLQTGDTGSTAAVSINGNSNVAGLTSVGANVQSLSIGDDAASDHNAVAMDVKNDGTLAHADFISAKIGSGSYNILNLNQNGGSNNLGVNVTGSNNQLDNYQSGNGNKSFVNNASGSNNVMSISQVTSTTGNFSQFAVIGNNNQVTSVQNGANTQNLSINGNSNVLKTSQTNDGIQADANIMQLVSFGDRNNITLTQDGNSNAIGQNTDPASSLFTMGYQVQNPTAINGSDNILTVTQRGNNNKAQALVQGSNDHSTIEQIGDGNTAFLNPQTSNDTGAVVQHGNNNTGSLTQTSVNGLNYTLTQTGNGLNATVVQTHN